MFTLSEENYLKAIYSINLRNDLVVSTNSIAQEMGTSAASVSDMLKKLQQKKLVEYTKYKGVSLSKKGKDIAIKIVRKHRLWETFLVNCLQFDWSEVHDIAEQLEHIQSQSLVDRLDEFLQFPKFDPHGEPIPNRNGTIVHTNTIPLTLLEVGNKAKVMGVSLDNKAFLDYLTTLQIRIGTEIELQNRIPFDQSLSIKINDHTQHISYEVAKHLLIKTI